MEEDFNPYMHLDKAAVLQDCKVFHGELWEEGHEGSLGCREGMR